MLTAISSRSITLSARLRFPMIKFRYGGARDNKTSSAAAPSSTSARGGQQPAGQIIYDFQLPPRYQRKPMSQEEIDYINRGGPA